MIRARSHYSDHAFYQIYFTLPDLQICGDENEIIISRSRPFVNRMHGKCEQFIEMLSSVIIINRSLRKGNRLLLHCIDGTSIQIPLLPFY